VHNGDPLEEGLSQAAGKDDDFRWIEKHADVSASVRIAD
jgi:hypothetical protein